ncbi:Large-conductance mechanosensitive channel [Candidatus Izimaplasma bacterium HR1]|jgi:large conductance mechanosensitive channel|uniref:large conductance mechanosensitive channel protein MscL n=1 Tax=Candidatus Izimoplasma sp. HR1 TaxID=1541959 RepID=UPI0004F749E6|nr:Large-conductance mechanosensitive channel [Candidatus Izimaplasma bacterium HR1]
MKNFIGEFKKFINRGSVIDLAVGFIIGAAFKDIVNSLVKDILTPVISLVVGDEGFSNYKYVITESNEALGIMENAIYYGNFIQAVFDFFIIAFVVFLIVKLINKVNDTMEKAKEDAVGEVIEAVEDVKPKMEVILLDIKELLKPGRKKEE